MSLVFADNPPSQLLVQGDEQLEAPAEELAESARSMIDTLVDAVPRVATALVLVILGYALSRGVRWALNTWLQRSRTASFARVMSKLAGWIVLGMLVLLAATVVFPSITPVDLLAGLGFVSVAVAFAFQDILENLLSGVLLLFRQPFESGDQIMVGDKIGTVEAITIRETRLVAFDGQLVVIPNRDVYKNTITVQTHNAYRRVDFVVGIAYENDIGTACEVVVETLRGVEGVAADLPAEALTRRLGVSTVDIEARFWTPSSQHDSVVVLDRAIRAVKTALDDAHIEMPADIIALQATPSFRAAIQGDRDVTPGGAVQPG